MTLIVCWKEGPDINCAADSRLSELELKVVQQKETERTITDVAGKILIVPISVFHFSDGKVLGKKTFSMGFAFSGSSMSAYSTFALASSCCQMINSKDISKPLDAQMIANIFKKSGEYVCVEAMTLQPGIWNRLRFDAFLFGFCESRKRTRLFKLKSSDKCDPFSMDIEEIELKEGIVYSLGDGASEFNRIYDSGPKINRSVIDAFKTVVSSDLVPSVGGNIQRAVANSKGAFIIPVSISYPSNPDDFNSSINGLNIESLADANGYSVGMGLEDHGAIKNFVVRRFIESRGFDPDKEDQKLTTTANLLYGIFEAVHGASNLEVDGDIELVAPIPQSGIWYLTTRCRKCHKRTPLCESLKFFEPKILFKRKPTLITSCFNCGARISANKNKLKSEEW